MDVIYEDSEILAINKPPGLIVESADTVSGETLADISQKSFGINLPRGGIVHRLDKDTSGIIILAKNQAALENLQSQFKDRKTKKEYWALAHGKMTEEKEVEGSIGRNPKNREKFVVLEEGKEAATRFEPLENLQFSDLDFQSIFDDLNKIQTRKLQKMNYNQFTLMRCFPKTGRTHQIRVHLKYINFPIVSDEKYTGRKTYRLDKRWCPRMFLHAKKIGFYHPGKGEWMELGAKLPEDLRAALKKLKGTNG